MFFSNRLFEPNKTPQKPSGFNGYTDRKGVDRRKSRIWCPSKTQRWDEKIHARCEVILSAGAIGSPQLLKLSGVGDPDELQPQGIRVLRDLKGVGKSLQDHL